MIQKWVETHVKSVIAILQGKDQTEYEEWSCSGAITHHLSNRNVIISKDRLSRSAFSPWSHGLGIFKASLKKGNRSVWFKWPILEVLHLTASLNAVHDVTQLLLQTARRVGSQLLQMWGETAEYCTPQSDTDSEKKTWIRYVGLAQSLSVQIWSWSISSYALKIRKCFSTCHLCTLKICSCNKSKTI